MKLRLPTLRFSHIKPKLKKTLHAGVCKVLTILSALEANLADKKTEGKQTLSELPEFEIFELLFKQKYGQNGILQTVKINGQLYRVSYNCSEAYKILDTIRKSSNITPTSKMVYNALYETIFGDNSPTKFVN